MLTTQSIEKSLFFEGRAWYVSQASGKDFRQMCITGFGDIKNLENNF